MKKLYATIAIIISFLLVAFFTTNDTTKNNKIPRVGVLQLMSHPALDEINKGINDSLKKSGYENGKNIHIDYLNAQGDQSNLNTMSNQLLQKNADVLVGIATPSAQSLANVTKKTPIVLSGVTDPKKSGLVKNNIHTGNNITGVSDQAPLDQQFELIKKIMPELRNIGIIYTSSDPSATTQMKQFKKIAEANNIKVHLASISSLNDLTQVTRSLIPKVESIYIPTDNTVASGLNNIKDITTQANIPVFPAAETMMKDGGLATVGLSQYEIGRQSGEMIVDILKHNKQPNKTPIRFIKKGKLIINLKQAKALHMKLPQSVINEAEKKGEIIR
ncbi:ABC transporter substrate-binding protein [Companilactobacillus sp. RD055328]|uniref:tryptophan ABC transporter substrate-binding protein n=1 Tax=Companilactobacillus sp. RD055328 TaxID=2916634 RepID=UPI001FC7FD28|nr:tryptophan ABC transporter substrate-binding protein [Companilactobacillus sp. RD055328]GKQ43210.1 ABC transporter substrate-binding protein [Companilactobacillus sp. RD055328]